MKLPMIIVAKDSRLPLEIFSWAESHSIAITDTFPEENQEYSYKYIIEYSEDISLDYLEMIYCHAKNIPATIVKTERLIIREIGLDDLDVYHRIIEDNPEAVSDNSILNLNKQDFKERHLAYIKYSYHFLGYGIWGIFLPDEKSSNYTMIGICGPDGTDVPSLSYALFPEYRKRGFAYEAASSVLKYCYNTLEMTRIRLNIRKNNISSIKLAEKLKETFPGALDIRM